MRSFKMARLLGWTSLAIGAIEIGATKWLQQEMGVEGHETLIQSLGVREVAAGAIILNQPGVTRTLANGLWGRVLGDVLDLTLLGEATVETRRPKGLATVTAIVLAVTGMDIIVASVVESQLQHGKSVSKAAKGRVAYTPANPNGQIHIESAPAELASAT